MNYYLINIKLEQKIQIKKYKMINTEDEYH